VSREAFNSLASAHIPQPTRPINTRSGTVITGILELSAGDLFVMALENVDVLADAGIPDDGSFVEGAG
jgi:hypothetical protein